MEFLGKRASDAIIEDLKTCGVFLDDSNLTLVQLSNGIRRVLGSEGARLIMERIFLHLNEFHNMPLVSKQTNHPL